jgi:hemolysin III
VTGWFAEQRNDVAIQPAPSWRGLSHQLAIVPISAVGVYFVLAAESLLGAIAIGVHASTLVCLLVTSTIYHRHCSTERWRMFARRADHAAIFFLIAGSYVPIALLATPRWLGLPVMLVVWLVAAHGARLKLRHLQLGQDRFHSWMYAALGWAAVILLPSMIARMGVERVVWILIGGAVYSVGGLVLIRKSPNPLPSQFGFHEIWHASVLLGAVIHLVVNASVT